MLEAGSGSTGGDRWRRGIVSQQFVSMFAVSQTRQEKRKGGGGDGEGAKQNMPQDTGSDTRVGLGWAEARMFSFGSRVLLVCCEHVYLA